MGNDSADRYWVGFDLGGTKMLATVYDRRFKPLGSERKKTKGHEGVKAGVDRIIDLIGAATRHAGIRADQISGIGIGSPGAIDLDRGIILESANLGWKDARLKAKLAEKFPCPIVVLNDVDAGIYAEYRFGSARGGRCVLGVFPGTGIGGGCVYEGRILRGERFSCMEIGHIQVVRDGRQCGCGRTGCLETEASRLAISADAARAAYRGEAPHLLSIAGTDITKIRSGVLAESIAAGDVVIEQLVRRAARFIGTAIGNVVNLLAPDIVVLGGGMVEAMPKLMIAAIDEAARHQAMPSFARSFKTVAAKLGDDANVLGAAGWVQTCTTASLVTA